MTVGGRCIDSPWVDSAGNCTFHVARLYLWYLVAHQVVVEFSVAAPRAFVHFDSANEPGPEKVENKTVMSLGLQDGANTPVWFVHLYRAFGLLVYPAVAPPQVAKL